MKKTITLLLTMILLILSTSACVNNDSKTSQEESTSVPSSSEESIPPTAEPEKAVIDTGYPAYDAKINEYATAMSMGEDAFFATYYYEGSPLNYVMIQEMYSYGGCIYYCIKDIDGNSVPELLFDKDNNTEGIIDIYTLNGNEIVKLFANSTFGERERLHVMSDGGLIREGSDSAFSAAATAYYIDQATNNLAWMYGLYYSTSNEPEHTEYYNGHGYERIDEDSYNDFVRRLPKDHLQLNESEWNMINPNPNTISNSIPTTESTLNKNGFPTVNSFENNFNSKISAFYSSLGYDAKAENYLASDYSVTELDGKYDNLITCSYGPGSNIILTAMSENGIVTSCTSVLILKDTNPGGDQLLAAAQTMLIPAMLYNNDLHDYSSAYEFLGEILANGIHSADGSTSTLTKNEIEYSVETTGFTISVSIKVVK